MKPKLFIGSDQKGSILLIALMVLLLGSLIALFLINSSTIETRIASNDKSYTTAFYGADAGVSPGMKVFLDTLDNKSVGSYGPLVWTPDATTGKANLLNEILGYQTSTDGRGFSFSTPATANNTTTNVRIRRIGVDQGATGSSVEFASGSEGIGYGSSGGTHIHYSITSTGRGPSQSHSSVTVETRYRKVLGIGGGK